MKALVTECQNLRYSLGAYYETQGMRQRQLEERRELLESASVETSIDMQGLLQESAGLKRANTAADGILEMGQSIMEELASQSDRLKRIRGAVLDVATALGISRNLLRVIERRQLVDKIILYGGMMILVVLLLVLWYFFK